MKNLVNTRLLRVKYTSPPQRSDESSAVSPESPDQTAAQVDITVPKSVVGFGLGLFTGVATMLVGPGTGGADLPVEQVIEHVESEPANEPGATANQSVSDSLKNVQFDVLANPELVVIPSELPREDFDISHRVSGYLDQEVGIHLGGGLVYDLRGDLFRAPTLVNGNSSFAGIVNPDSLTSTERMEISRLSEFEQPGERVYRIKDFINSYTVTLGDGFATIDEHPISESRDGELDARITSDGETVKAEWDLSEQEPKYAAILRESSNTGELEITRPYYSLASTAPTQINRILELPPEDVSSVVVPKSDGESSRILNSDGHIFNVQDQSVRVESAKGKVISYEFEGGRTSSQDEASRNTVHESQGGSMSSNDRVGPA